MPSVRFEPAGFEAAVEPGQRLVDLVDDRPEAGVPFSCRAATCGTCRVEVREGAEALSPPQEEEQEILALFGDGPDVRLGCQLTVSGDAPTPIVLRVKDD